VRRSISSCRPALAGEETHPARDRRSLGRANRGGTVGSYLDHQACGLVSGEEVRTMEGTFRLKIELGNSAMDSPEQVGELLRRAAGMVETGAQRQELYDSNGNGVGYFVFHDPD
jgi:hypothetical protein